MSNSTTGKEIDPNGVDHPAHYNLHKSGIETINVIRHMPYALGAAVKYVVRRDHKDGTKDLKKAVWYLDDLLVHPPMLAQIQTAADVRHFLREHVEAEVEEAEALFMTAVLEYVSGHGPAALDRAKHYVLQLIAKQEESDG